jgi:tricorn protease
LEKGAIMKSSYVHVVWISLCLVCSSGYGAKVWGAQYPAPSPDGSKISFSYYGDIWVTAAQGGKAERLTVSSGFESRSFWSPDGKIIAFNTDRWGNEDICVMPANGSAPAQRLTYYSENDILYGWTPDARHVVFGGNRHTLRPALYRISPFGGLPEMIADFAAYYVCFMPEGDRLYYCREGAPWWRRRYRGGADQDIWFTVLADSVSKRITDSPGRDGFPMYSRVDDKLYFLSNRADDGVNNLWRMELDGSNPKQLTFHTEDIHYPEMSADGSIIAYECFGELYTYAVGTGENRQLRITATEDYQEEPFFIETFTKDASECALSPDEQEIALVVHGDIFMMSLKEGKSDKITRITDTPFVEKDVSWHPKKEMLVYAALEDGDFDIYSIEPRDEEKFCDAFLFSVQKILETPETEYKPQFSPDGEKIAFQKHRRELHIMNSEGRGSRKLVEESDVLWIDWSPDSKWITYSRTTLGWREDIFVVAVDGARPAVNISEHPNDDYKPMWSSDGRRIAFASRDAVGSLWMKYIFCTKQDEERDKDYWDTQADTLEKDDSVRIDFDDIEERTHTVTKVDGFYNYVAQSPDGKQYAILAENQGSMDIWTVDWLGKELQRVTTGNVNPKQFTVSRDKKKIYYLSGTGTLAWADIATSKTTPLNFTAEMGIDRHAEQEQVYTEAWWALQDGFYDSDFHGIDWRAVYEKYRDLALHTRTTREFHAVVSQMIGELNASHLAIWNPHRGGETTGELGIVYDPDYEGPGVRIKEIIPESPADDAEVGLETGDIIRAINGKTIKPGDNYYKYLVNKNSKEVMLDVVQRGRQRNVKIRCGGPDAIWDLVYKQWQKSNRDHVYAASNNRIGYLYIPSMGSRSLKQFEQDLYREMDKEALIIDIRYNGGGNIHDELLNILRRTAYMYSVERDGSREYNSLFRWDKPIVLIINEHCYSDAEIFPAGFKELGLGTVIGVPTYGAVIGTNDIELSDGSIFRVPGTGWFLLTGENLENTPVEPHIYVENAPEDDGSSTDPQLLRAVDVLQEIIGE